MFLDHTSFSDGSPDAMVEVTKDADSYGWVQMMGTNEPKIHLVNKKSASITVDVAVSGVADISNIYMDSVIGGGPNQTITDGFHPLDKEGVIVRTDLSGFHGVTLEPHSANIISFTGTIDENADRPEDPEEPPEDPEDPPSEETGAPASSGSDSGCGTMGSPAALFLLAGILPALPLCHRSRWRKQS